MPQDRFLYGRDAFAFVEALDGLSAVGEVIDALEREIAHFGFEALLLSGLDPEQQFDHQVLASRWPQEFLELYTRRHYVKCDPIARLCRQSAVPIEWSEASYANERNPRALEVMDTAAQFRLQRGFIVPIHGPNGYEACVARGSDRTAPGKQAGAAPHCIVCLQPRASDGWSSQAWHDNPHSARAGSTALDRARQGCMGGCRDSPYLRPHRQRVRAVGVSQVRCR